MLRQEAVYIASAMPTASFLASKKIPLIKSDNCRGGPTPAKEKKPPTEINLPALRERGCDKTHPNAPAPAARYTRHRQIYNGRAFLSSSAWNAGAVSFVSHNPLSRLRGRSRVQIFVALNFYRHSGLDSESLLSVSSLLSFGHGWFLPRAARASGASDYNRNCRRRRHLLKPSAVSCRL